MATAAYKAPWAKGYDVSELKEKFNKGYKRATKKSLAAANMGYSMSRGYYDKEEDNWGPKPQKPQVRTVRLASGRYAKVYDDGGYGPGKEFGQIASDQELADYVDSTNFTYTIEGCGHIALLEYSPRRNVMRVTFQPETAVINGKEKTWGRDDIAVYFKVPTAVFGELYWLAESKVTQASPVTGETRHALGIKFWDLVRIRHTRTGGRYPYTVEHVKEYAKKEKPVSQWKIEQDKAEARLFGKGASKEYDASDEAFKKAAKAAAKEALGSTAKDDAIAAVWGSYDNAMSTLDTYGEQQRSKIARDNYAALTTLTDKYNFLLKHGEIDDYINEEE